MMNQIKQGYKQTKVGVIPEDWEVVKLSSISEKISDGIHTTPVYSDNTNFFFINGNNLMKNCVQISDTTKTVSEYEYKKHRIDLDSKTILMSINGTIGNLAIYNNEKIILGKSACYIILKNKSSLKFIYLLLQSYSIQKSFESELTGSTIKNLSLKTIKDTLIPLPPLKEQEKIAEILTTWDEAITKQTELIEAKELQKKGLMQKLLSGEVRFDGFSDEWEEVKLGGIGEFKTSSIDKIVNENEKLVNLINYMDVYRNKHIDKNFKCSETSLKEEQYEKVNLKKGDILFTPSSETPDDIGHSAVIIEDLANTVYSYHLVRFRPKKSIDIKFSGYVFNNVDILKEFARRANGSTRFTLSIKDFNETKVQLPSLEEQQKIAEVLSLADAEINLLKNELKELKLQKKALMQKLLTGEVRVKV